MNIFKRNKFVVTALISAMILALARQPLPAMERRGSTVAVTLTLARGTVQGELLAVKEDALLIYDHSAGRGQRIELQDVFQVKIVKKSKFFGFAVIGMVFGFALADLQHRNEDRASLLYGAGYLFLPFQFGLIGGIAGAIAGTDKRFSLAGESSQFVEEKLNQLKRYAREQDVQKPAVSVKHRFGLLWSPGWQNSSGKIDFRDEKGTFRFVHNAFSNYTAVYSFKPISKFYPSGYMIAGQLRLEYKWTPHLSSSLEFIASGKLDGYQYNELSYDSIDYAGRYASPELILTEYSHHSLLLGLNWRPFSLFFSRRNIIELGIAAGPALAQVNMEYRYSWNPNSNPPHQFKALTWSCKVHAAYDYYYTDNFSFGIFIAYQYLRASFPGATFFNEEQEFKLEGNYQSAGFTRATEFVVPGYKIHLYGTACGILVGLRF